MPKPVIKGGYTPDWGSVVGGLITGTFTQKGNSDELIAQDIYISIAGTFVGTVVIERWIGGAWVAVDTVTTPKTQTIEYSRALRYRLRCSSYTSGVINTAMQD